jgi:hypothetical protein
MRSCALALLLAVAGCAGKAPPPTEAEQAAYLCVEQGLPRGTTPHRDCVARRLAYIDSADCVRRVVTVGTPEYQACLAEHAAMRAAARR